MSAHIIGNSVPTPEQMGQILGLSSERVAAVRRIMSSHSKQAATDRPRSIRSSMARKKSTPVRRRARIAPKS